MLGSLVISSMHNVTVTRHVLKDTSILNMLYKRLTIIISPR